MENMDLSATFSQSFHGCEIPHSEFGVLNKKNIFIFDKFLEISSDFTKNSI